MVKYRYSSRHSKIYIEVLPGSVYMYVSGKGRYEYMQSVSWNNRELSEDLGDAMYLLQRSEKSARRWLRGLKLHIENEDYTDYGGRADMPSLCVACDGSNCGRCDGIG